MSGAAPDEGESESEARNWSPPTSGRDLPRGGVARCTGHRTPVAGRVRAD